VVIFDKSGIWCGAGFGAGYRLGHGPKPKPTRNVIYKTSKVRGYFFSSHHQFNHISSTSSTLITTISDSKHLNSSNIFKNFVSKITMSTSAQPKQTIAVLGATGGCVLNFLIRALQNGHTVSARKIPFPCNSKYHLTESSRPHSIQAHQSTQRKRNHRRPARKPNHPRRKLQRSNLGQQSSPTQRASRRHNRLRRRSRSRFQRPETQHRRPYHLPSHRHHPAQSPHFHPREFSIELQEATSHRHLVHGD